jgi:hypothetical protein
MEDADFNSIIMLPKVTYNSDQEHNRVAEIIANFEWSYLLCLTILFTYLP